MYVGSHTNANRRVHKRLTRSWKRNADSAETVVFIDLVIVAVNWEVKDFVLNRAAPNWKLELLPENWVQRRLLHLKHLGALKSNTFSWDFFSKTPSRCDRQVYISARHVFANACTVHHVRGCFASALVVTCVLFSMSNSLILTKGLEFAMPDSMGKPRQLSTSTYDLIFGRDYHGVYACA